jgi:hypothetical protein
VPPSPKEKNAAEVIDSPGETIPHRRAAKRKNHVVRSTDVGLRMAQNES